LVLLAGAASAASESSQAPDVAAVQEKLQSMLAGSQQRLQVVEQKNAELVKKMKDKAGKLLTDQAEFLGQSIQDYSKKLWDSEASLRAVQKEAQDAMDAYEKDPSRKPGTTPQNEMDAKASLLAKISVAQRQLRRAQTRREGALTTVESDALERLDDEAMKLGSKLGDLSKMVDPAKQELSQMNDEANEDPVKLAKEKADAAAAMAADDPDAGLLDVMQKDGMDVKPTTPAKTVEAKPAEKKAAAKVETKKEEPKKKAKSFKELGTELDKALKEQTKVVKDAGASFRGISKKDETESAKKFEDLAKELVAERSKLAKLS